MYLHEDREAFQDIIEQTADNCGRTLAVVEKDYYVTLILKLLAEQLENCVFKGGTSLSKGFRVIDRFSEDIDITFNEHIGESRRKKLKNAVLKGISEELEMPIANWQEIQSDRDYNVYLFSYESVSAFQDDRLPQYVKLETALGSYSFPTQSVEIRNYIGDYLEGRGRTDLAEQFFLGKFSMNLQSLERTYIDKVFALCDYYLQGRSKRYSRHLYDIYKLTPLIKFDNEFAALVREVRKHRSKMKVCLSAKDEIDVPKVILEFCDNSFYREDYQAVTSYFAADEVPYDDVIGQMRVLAADNLFVK
ncbi:MAG: nucleotidyl transferase AbiEii/AbiGii toxin family protein [Butyrivibrio sp.]|nr:nucleotidyl transferase AbiEii/AbiGii toxin family protein [Acetatifactor muris]MCM1559930.1 nucleotidyl transferase AbiEii/AbiGii toxin family protein [Butyrivibrio sp.]